MKRFKTISTTFIIIIAVIFACNVCYLVNLYESIRSTVERDVKSALADADLDELWIRAERANRETRSKIASGEQEPGSERRGETSVIQDSEGNMISATRYPDGSVATGSISTDKDISFANKFVNTVGKQFHSVMDPYVDINLEIMDSVFTKRLNDRFIRPQFVAVEVIDLQGNVVKRNSRDIADDYDVVTYSFNPDAELAYRAYITPLTRHIFSEMSGVIVTVILLTAVFSLAFIYLYRTVSRLRTIEEMKDDFVSNMTHELKTPIAIAYSANDALLNYDTSNDPSKKETYLLIANKQLKRLGELVENILAMSMERRKTMKLEKEAVQLRPLLEEIAAAQRMRGDKAITIEIKGDDNVSVESDKTHLSNVLNNLIDNAIKYSGDRVRIVMTYDADGLSIADDGIGIPAKSIPYLFNKFYRVPHCNRQDVRGYGIGLYYVKSILDKMGWHINVKSKEGEGSTFTIKFNNDNE